MSSKRSAPHGGKAARKGSSKKWKTNNKVPVRNMRCVSATCSKGHERKCGRELIAWMESVYEEHRNDQVKNDDRVVDKQSMGVISVSKELEMELAALRNPSTQSAPFTVAQAEANTGVCIIQIKDDTIDECQLITWMLQGLVKRTYALKQEVISSSDQPTRQVIPQSALYTRYTASIIPLSRTFYPNKETFVKVANEYIPNAFARVVASLTEHKMTSDLSTLTFAIDIKRRAKTAALARQDLIDTIIPLIPTGYSVNLSQPHILILVQVNREFCALSVVQNVPEFKQFKIREIVGEQQLDE